MQTLLTHANKQSGPRSAWDADHEFAISLLENLGVPTFVLDVDRRVLLWNKACERLTGISAQEVVGTKNQWRAFYNERRPCLADLVMARRVKEIGALYAKVSITPPSEFGVAAENWCVMPRLGHPLYLAIDASPIYDRSGNMIAAAETLRDITVQKQRQIELESLATRDGLTGLFNRRSFDERLAEEARRAARDKRPLSLLMIDIDLFKTYNDAHGHQTGDACLRAVALAISGALSRAGDIAARYGGDEFAVILPGASRSGAARIAQRVRRGVDDLGIRRPASTVSQRITVSIGGAVATTCVDGSSEALIASADAALYRAKRQGRNRTQLAPSDGSASSL